MIRIFPYLILVMLSAAVNGEGKGDDLLVCEDLRQAAQARLLKEAEKKKFKECESKPAGVEEENNSRETRDVVKDTGKKKDV